MAQTCSVPGTVAMTPITASRLTARTAEFRSGTLLKTTNFHSVPTKFIKLTIILERGLKITAGSALTDIFN